VRPKAEPPAFFIDVFQGVVPAARRRRARKPDVEKGRTEIVYELYRLTDEEIEIVEEAVGD